MISNNERRGCERWPFSVGIGMGLTPRDFFARCPGREGVPVDEITCLDPAAVHPHGMGVTFRNASIQPFHVPEYRPPDLTRALFSNAPLVQFKPVGKAGVAPDDYHGTSCVLFSPAGA